MKINKKGLGKNPENMSEEEQLKLAMMLSLQEGNKFDLKNNRFTKDLNLSCQNVSGDGFCFFRAIAKQIVDRNLNIGRHPPLLSFPVTMEEVLERVAIYFNQHYQQLLDKIFPPPCRQDFGSGDQSEKLYQEAFTEYNNPIERQKRLEGFRDNFYEYINLGNYDVGDRQMNAADWLPQIISEVLLVDIDIYDGQRPGAGFRTNNSHRERIGLGRINNNHYVSLDGDLEAAWIAEQKEILRAGFNAEQQRLDLLQGKSIKVNPLIIQYYQHQQMLKSHVFTKPEFLLRQLIEYNKLGKYLIGKIQSPAVNDTLKFLNEMDEDLQKEGLKVLKPEEITFLWKAVENLEGYEKLKLALWKERERSMQIMPFNPNKHL